MATNIRLKSSSLSGKTPTLSDLSLRELAVNTVDGKLFLRKGNGTGSDKIIDVTAPLQASEPMGHEDKAQSVISFNAGTRVFTIQPSSTSFNVWCKGVKYNFTTAQTVTIPNTTGIYYIYFDSDGVLQYRLSYFDWENDAPTAYVYWNATTGTAPFVADERHGIVLDWQTHEYLHRTRGAVIANGFSISNYTTTGTGANNADAQFDLAGGTFFDEDLEVIITHSNTPTSDTWQQDLQGPSQIPVFYQSGNAWVRDTPTDYALKQGTARITYNLFSGGTWTTPDVPTDTHYTTSWIIATNNINYPVIAIMGQSESNKITDQESIGFGDLVLDGFPVVEFRPLWKIIWQTDSGYANTPNARVAGVYDIRQLSAGGGFTGATPVSDHGLLTGLGDDDHLQYLHVTETRTGVTAEFNTTGKITTTNRVGIGVTNPSYPLEVAYSGTDSLVSGIFIGGGIISRSSGTLKLAAGSQGGTVGGNSILLGSGGGITLDGGSSYTDGIELKGGAGNIKITQGNVGIGTTNPISKLQVIGSGVFEAAGGFSAPSGDNPTNVPLIAKLTNPIGDTFFGAINAYSYPCFAININSYTDSTTDRGIVRFYDKTDGNWNNSIVLNTGKVGIGTTNPGSILSVNGFITENPGDGTYWNVVTQKDIGFNANQVPLNQYLGQLAFVDTYSPSGLRRDGGGVDDVFVNSEGNVGIGITNAIFSLQVGSGNFGNVSGKAGIAITADSQIFNTFGTGGDLVLRAQRPTDIGGGSITLGGSARGDWRPDSVLISTNNTSRIFVSNTGNVGIGTTAPSNLLHVQGTILIAGSYETSNNLFGQGSANITGGVATTINQLSATIYRSVEYTIQAVQGTNYHVTKILVVHDGTNVHSTEYGTIITNTSVATYSIDISGGNIVVTATPSSASTTSFKIAIVGLKV